MKGISILFGILILPIFVKSQIATKKSFDFYFERSKKNWFENNKIKTWEKRGDSAILRVGYWKGDCCGSVPDAGRITAKIEGDTIFYNLNTQRRPGCKSEIGVCGSAIDLIINTKKYKHYKKLVLKEIRESDCKSDSCFMNAIDVKVNSTSLVKKEMLKDLGYRGGYVKYVAYFDKNTPVLIEMEEKIIMHLYLTNGTEDDHVTYTRAKFYITNWNEGKFLRVGQFGVLRNGAVDYNQAMKPESRYEYDKDIVSKLLE